MKVLKYGLLGVVLLVALGVGGLFYLGVQSKSGEAPGLVEGTLTACPSSPNCVSSEAGTPEDQSVEALPLGAWDALPEALAEMGGTVTVQDTAYLAAEFTSSTFGFVDDVEFRLAEDAVHVRSASRVGYSDRGVNRERVAALRGTLAAD